MGAIKSLILFITAAAVAGGALAQPIHAALITGQIGFSGGVIYDTSSPGNATAVTSWNNLIATITTGTFTNAPHAVSEGSPVTFTSQRWNLNTSMPITNFWSVAGFNFELVSSQIIAQNGTLGSSGYVVVAGAGVVSGNGFTPTAFSWAFTSQDPPFNFGPSVWIFSAACSSDESNGAPVLLATTIPNAVVLSWNDPTFTLQAAPTVSGIYTNIPGAISPYTNSLTGPEQFFRLNQ